MSNQLYLVDASSWIFRAFFALPPLTTSKGLPTQATFGFTKMIMRLMEERQPTYIAIIFDPHTKTFRNDLYPDYKAQRKGYPADLEPQLPYIHEIIGALGIAQHTAPGFEADDLIASFTKKFVHCAEIDEIVIVGTDKDLMQLVGDKVSMLDTTRSSPWIKAPEVEKKFGVWPWQVTDVLALMGDSSDNIPGVKGIGPKTASKLIKTYGSLDRLYHNYIIDNLEEQIKGAAKIREKLLLHKDTALLSYQLVKLKSDIPIDASLEALRPGGVSRTMLNAIFETLELKGRV